MFRFTQGFEFGSEELYKSERFVEHATGVIQTVDTAVSMLGPNVDALAEILYELGKKHTRYGAVPQHYVVVGQALLDTLETALRDNFTDEVKAAWAQLYNIVSTNMIKGAHEGFVPN